MQASIDLKLYPIVGMNIQEVMIGGAPDWIAPKQRVDFSFVMDLQGKERRLPTYGVVISNDDDIGRILLEKLKDIQGEVNQQSINSNISLTAINENLLDDILLRMSRNKGISFDSISDSIFYKPTAELRSILKRLWTIPLAQIGGQHFQARLVALNKAHPGIPTKDQFRPIIVLSPIIKYLEARFLPRISEYLCRRLNRCQVGFVPGKDRFLNITRLLIQGNKLRSQEGRIRPHALVFIDYSNAYNTVKRDSLYQRLIEKQIMSQSETEWLKTLHSMLEIKIGNNKLRCKDGLAQGSMISPGLFNIYVTSNREAH